MAIISASRRTDIPTYFGEWLVNRLEAGEVYTRNNPYNPNAVSHITFSKEDIDCVVLWTKNPASIMPFLERLKAFPCYFQYTITGYGKQVESNVPELSKSVEMFKELSRSLTRASSDYRVIWRYDPIIFTKEFTPEWHLKNFETIAKSLAGFTNRVVISFVDIYSFVKTQMQDNKIISWNADENKLTNFCRRLAEIAHCYGMEIYTCAETIDLAKVGIKHGSCIDKAFIENMLGYKLKVKKDKSQRPTCGCVESVDIGKYNTCPNGCVYCFARKNPSETMENFKMYDVNSPILCDTIKPTDIITERRLSSMRIPEEYDQLSLF